MAELAEKVQDLRTLLQGQEVIKRGVKIKLRKIPDSFGVPIYIAATGPKMLRLAARLGDGVIMMIGSDRRLIRYAIENVRKGAEEAGKDPETLDLVAWIACSISEDRAIALKEVKPFIARLIMRPMPANLTGLTDDVVTQVTSSYDFSRHVDLSSPALAHVPESVLDSLSLAGTPEDCLRKCRVLEEEGITQIAANIYSKDRENVLRTFATHVIEEFSKKR
jgi:5,10-methylenetetrahydromethanopterin reductase